jgi:hypothetical protein
MTLLRIALALLCATWLSGCSNDNPAAELTRFASDLVENHTRDDNEPAEIEARPFSDSEDPNAFSASFFG